MTAVANRRGKVRTMAGMGFIARQEWSQGDTRWTTAHAEQEVATAGAPRSGSKITGDGGRWRPVVGGH
jgi:hypothetical protein